MNPNALTTILQALPSLVKAAEFLFKGKKLGKKKKRLVVDTLGPHLNELIDLPHLNEEEEQEVIDTLLEALIKLELLKLKV